MISVICENLKKQTTNQAHRHREQIGGYQECRRGGGVFRWGEMDKMSEGRGRTVQTFSYTLNKLGI